MPYNKFFKLYFKPTTFNRDKKNILIHLTFYPVNTLVSNHLSSMITETYNMWFKEMADKRFVSKIFI